MNLDLMSARSRLEAALDGLAVTFRGMTARADEYNCECHWGGAEELALLKLPDVALEPDLLRRTWQAPDWSDHASVLRRILPQLAAALVDGRVEPVFGMSEAGLSFARGRWQQWPERQVAAAWEFLHAWWAYILIDPDPRVPAHEIFALFAEASGTLAPWLGAWQSLTHQAADQRLAEAVAHWRDALLHDRLPWISAGDEDAMRTELTGWLVRYAPSRLVACGVEDDLLHWIRLWASTPLLSTPREN
ncbi:hypothetical protein [Phytohabitans aurantiacus]|uniref:Uncharacterized protein n=1 Tax=Phytohabitans aurantiacus TaxID=3016789 RepID=A0ABQ5R333_9ACTN|nr:hypothetical protein [Phytohabitans aurantiacus]GLI00633.1 hypothetical protein Pa4123_59090 [Phytohabitans aurantiacus]